MSVHVTVRLSDRVASLVQQAARAQRRSISNLINVHLEDALVAAGYVSAIVEQPEPVAEEPAEVIEPATEKPVDAPAKAKPAKPWSPIAPCPHGQPNAYYCRLGGGPC